MQRGLGERDQNALEMVATYASDEDRVWALLAMPEGRKRLLEAVATRTFARNLREGKPVSAGGVTFAAKLRSVLPVLQLLLEKQPEAVGIFAGRKKRRALVRYVEGIATDDLGALRDGAEYVGALLGSRIAQARRRRAEKMERAVTYLSAVVTSLGEEERALVALREIEAAAAQVQVRLLARTAPATGGPRISHADVAGGPLTSSLVAAVRAVVWDRSITDVEAAGRALGDGLPAGVRRQLAIHVVRFALTHLVAEYGPAVLDDTALDRMRAGLERARKAVVAGQGIPEEMITEALRCPGTVLLRLPETAAANVRQYVLRVHKEEGVMRGPTETYRAVAGRRNALRRESDGALVRILEKREVRGLRVFCAAYVQ